jgi:hypothetical protein
VNNLSVAGVSLVDSTSWVSNLLSFISEAIGNGVVPQVQPGITQSVLKDMIQKITPNVLNAIVGNLMNPGVDIKLPDYLPAPLANYPLKARSCRARVLGSTSLMVRWPTQTGFLDTSFSTEVRSCAETLAEEQ